MKIQVLDNAKKKKFLRELEVFGLKKIRETLVRSGKERIRAFSGDLSREETETALQSERFAVRSASPVRAPSAGRALRCQTAENTGGSYL